MEIIGDTPQARRFVEQRLATDELPHTAKLIGFKDNAGIMGVWVFDRYTGVNGSVYVHWAGRGGNWLRARMIRVVAAYVFRQLRCKQALGEVAGSDTHTQRVNEKLGFRRIGEIPGYFPEDDLVLYVMKHEECRWL